MAKELTGGLACDAPSKIAPYVAPRGGEPGLSGLLTLDDGGELLGAVE